MTRKIVTLVISLVCILVFAPPSRSLDIEISPREVIPGDILLVKIRDVEPGSTSGTFLENTYRFFPAEDGVFLALIPVDINTAPNQYPLLITNGSRQKSLGVRIKSHAFRTIKLTLPEEKVTLSPDNQKRVEREYVIQKSIWEKRTDRAWNGSFSLPLDTEISTEFGVKRIMNEKKMSVHRGVDFRGKTGTPVKSLNAGTVVLAEDLFYGGHTLIIDHGMGLYSVYMHLSKFSVKKDEAVQNGQVIGFVGSSGRVTGPHLHLSVKLNGISVNPESLFRLAF